MIYDPRRATSLLLKETDDSYTRPGRDRFIKVRTLSEKINPYYVPREFSSIFCREMQANAKLPLRTK